VLTNTDQFLGQETNEIRMEMPEVKKHLNVLFSRKVLDYTDSLNLNILSWRFLMNNRYSVFQIDPEYHEKSYAIKTNNTNRHARRVIAAFPQIHKDFTQIFRMNNTKKIYFEDLIINTIFYKKNKRFNLQYHRDPNQVDEEEKEGHYEIKDRHLNKFKELLDKLKTIVSKFLKIINEMMNFKNDNRDKSIKMFKVSTLSHF
jgi:hypothetical protein